MTNPLTITARKACRSSTSSASSTPRSRRVFRAHQDPELVKQWLGPRGYEMDIER